MKDETSSLAYRLEIPHCTRPPKSLFAQYGAFSGSWELILLQRLLVPWWEAEVVGDDWSKLKQVLRSHKKRTNVSLQLTSINCPFWRNHSTSSYKWPAIVRLGLGLDCYCYWLQTFLIASKALITTIVWPGSQMTLQFVLIYAFVHWVPIFFNEATDCHNTSSAVKVWFLAMHAF